MPAGCAGALTKKPRLSFGADGRAWALARLPTEGMREQRVSAAPLPSQHLALTGGLGLSYWGGGNVQSTSELDCSTVLVN